MLPILALAGGWNSIKSNLFSSRLRWVERLRGEIDQAHRELETERERLLAERAELEMQIAALEQEIQVVAHLGTQSNETGKEGSQERTPLSRRVLEALRGSQSGLTSGQMRERLGLDYRESRNLGPVLHQLAKSGRVANDGRGAPWRLTPKVSAP